MLVSQLSHPWVKVVRIKVISERVEFLFTVQFADMSSGSSQRYRDFWLVCVVCPTESSDVLMGSELLRDVSSIPSNAPRPMGIPSLFLYLVVFLLLRLQRPSRTWLEMSKWFPSSFGLTVLQELCSNLLQLWVAGDSWWFLMGKAKWKESQCAGTQQEGFMVAEAPSVPCFSVSVGLGYVQQEVACFGWGTMVQSPV